MRLASVGLALALLSACSGAGPGGLSTFPNVFRSAPEAVSVARGAVEIGGPDGYCVDRRGSRLNGQTAFVLLASCASLTGEPDPAQPDPGLLTASVDGATEAPVEIAALRRFLQTNTGRATLAQDGQAGSVRLVETQIWRDALVLKIRDTSPPIAPGLTETYWRAFFTVNRRLITVTVFAFESRPIGTDAGRRKLQALISRIRTLSSDA